LKRRSWRRLWHLTWEFAPFAELFIDCSPARPPEDVQHFHRFA
jgi:hypothetical protein